MSSNGQPCFDTNDGGAGGPPVYSTEKDDTRVQLAFVKAKMKQHPGVQQIVAQMLLNREEEEIRNVIKRADEPREQQPPDHE